MLNLFPFFPLKILFNKKGLLRAEVSVLASDVE